MRGFPRRARIHVGACVSVCVCVRLAGGAWSCACFRLCLCLCWVVSVEKRVSGESAAVAQCGRRTRAREAERAHILECIYIRVL